MDRNLDKFTEKIDEMYDNPDEELKLAIIRKTERKIGRYKRFQSIRGIAAVFAVIILVSAFVPGTPVNALYKKIFSFIPGVGVVETDKNGSSMRVLKDPVIVESGKEYVTVEAAFTQNNRMTVYVKTNVGMAGAANFTSKELLKLYAGEINPKLYLIHEGVRIEPVGSVMTGASEDGTYALRASYELPKEMIRQDQMTLKMEKFEPGISVSLSEAITGFEPELMGNFAVIEDIYVFADMNREADTVRIQLSTVAPKELESIRFEPYDHEKAHFPDSVRLTDSQGNIYLPDLELRKSNHADRNTFYFRVSEDKSDLLLIIPQIMYRRSDLEDVEFKLPNGNQVMDMNETLSSGGNEITVKTVELLAKESDRIPEEFKGAGGLKIDFSAVKSPRGQETIMRIMPTLKVKKGLLGQYEMISQAVHGETWSLEDQTGFAICTLDDLEEYKRISMSLDVECIIISEVELKLE